MKDGYHLSLSLSRELWEDLLGTALPISFASGTFDVARNARAALRQLPLRERVRALIGDQRAPAALVHARDVARAAWERRRMDVYSRLDQLLRIEGEYTLDLDDLGSQFRYGEQKVSADAYLRARVRGVVYLLGYNVEIPFELEKRAGVSLTLGDIRFERSEQAVLGSLRDLGLHLGDHTVLQLLSRLGEYLLEQQLPHVAQVPILRREQLDEMVGGLGGPLRMRLGVERLDLAVNEEDLTLSVKFGFANDQLEQRDARHGEDREEDR
jgi:hypothetical protein